MTPAEARALIAEGRKHDEAMTAAPWKPCGGTKGQCICRLVWSIPADVAVCQAQSNDATGRAEDAAGIAWLRTNLRALLDGYAAEMDEVRRLREVVLRQSGVLTEQQIAACMEVP